MHQHTANAAGDIYLYCIPGAQAKDHTEPSTQVCTQAQLISLHMIRVCTRNHAKSVKTAHVNCTHAQSGWG